MMKTLLSFLLLLSFCVCSAQQSTTPTQFNTIADLRKQSAADRTIVPVSGLTAFNDKNGGNYIWNATSTAVDDGFTTIKVDNVATGRWIKMTNDNTIKGNAIFNGVILQTAYVVNYPAPLPFVPAMIIIQPTSQNAAALSWISNKTTTGFTVNFLSVPVVGTNNITFDYIIIKL